MNAGKHEHIISRVLPGSIAEELEIEAGDKLIAVNGCEIEDVFDYHFYTSLRSRKNTRQIWALNLNRG